MHSDIESVVMITGALGGIGGAVARLLAAPRTALVLTDIGGSAEALLATIASAGGQASFLPADLADEAQAAAVVEHAVANFGRLDGAFNNAGVGQHGKAITELSGDEWAKVMTINAQGMFHCVKHQLRVMREGGAIVNTASALGQMAIPFAAEYIASKHAVIGLTRAAAIEAAPRGIRVNAVLPGIVDTPMARAQFEGPEMAAAAEHVRQMHPLGRFGQAAEIGHAVRWLLSSEASFTTGACFAIDGGLTAT